jgi:hypothetical protein
VYIFIKPITFQNNVKVIQIECYNLIFIKCTISKCLFFLAYADDINLLRKNFNTSHKEKHVALLHGSHVGLEIMTQEVKYKFMSRH